MNRPISRPTEQPVATWVFSSKRVDDRIRPSRSAAHCQPARVSLRPTSPERNSVSLTTRRQKRTGRLRPASLFCPVVWRLCSLRTNFPSRISQVFRSERHAQSGSGTAVARVYGAVPVVVVPATEVCQLPETRKCPKCGAPMYPDRRPKPEGPVPMAVEEDWWVCPNPRCGHSEIAT